MHLFIEFLFENQASLNNRAVQLLAWLSIYVSAKFKMWPISTQCETIRDAFTLQFLITGRCSLASLKSVLCRYWNSLCTGLCTMTIHSDRFYLWFSLFDSHHSVVQGSCWTMGKSNSVWFEETIDCFWDVSDVWDYLQQYCRLAISAVLLTNELG